MTRDLAPLTREEMIAAIEGRSEARRVPVCVHMWVHPERFAEREPAVRAVLDRYPSDIRDFGMCMPRPYEAPEDDATYCWMHDAPPDAQQVRGRDAAVCLKNWSDLDAIFAVFPDPEYRGLFPVLPTPDGRYRLAKPWKLLWERHWSLRGMENALMDFHDHSAHVLRLYERVTAFNLRIMERARREAQTDGIMFADDLGTQRGSMFSLPVFREFLRPFYGRMIRRAHELGLHFWLHTCGDVTLFLDDLVEMGLDVIHPIQKYAMDERAMVARWGGRIAFWAGFDVQQTLPWGRPDAVRREVLWLVNTFHRPGEGRLIMTAGNGINEDCSVENLDAFLDESFRYGKAKCHAKA